MSSPLAADGQPNTPFMTLRMPVTAEATTAAMDRVVAATKPGEKTITEGTATIVFGSQNECFYNKVQVGVFL